MHDLTSFNLTSEMRIAILTDAKTHFYSAIMNHCPDNNASNIALRDLDEAMYHALESLEDLQGKEKETKDSER